MCSRNVLPRSLRPLLLVAGGILVTGCQLTPAPGLVACPLPVTEQVSEILKIAPMGTPRDEVQKRLEKAGFAGAFGSNQSLFYCDVWDKGDGVRWHTNVVLLFDDEGKLYATQPDRDGRIDPTPHSTQAQADRNAAPAIDPFQ